jgi:predicted flap endonuclease-1-like 5' DNA nuclease
MNSNFSALINLGIVWGIASAGGFVAMAALMVMGDWTLLQGLFAAAVIFFALGTLLSLMFLRPLPGPQVPGSAGVQPDAKPLSTPRRVGEPAAPAAPVAAAAPAAEVPAAAAAGRRPEAMSAPREAGADDLKKIKGVGPKLEELLHSLGFYHYDQIAAWSAEEVAWVDENLEGFKGRVSRDDWVAQARRLAAGEEA